MRAILIDLDGALGDTRPLWDDWLAGAPPGCWGSTRQRYRPTEARQRRRWMRPEPGTGARCSSGSPRADARLPPSQRRGERRAAAGGAAGRPIGVFTDAPEGARSSRCSATRRRSLDGTLEAGTGALDRLAASLGSDATVVRTRDELVAAAAS